MKAHEYRMAPKAIYSYIAAALVLAAGAASAEQLACTKIGFQPGAPDPNNCLVVVGDTPSTIVNPSGTASAEGAKTEAGSKTSRSLADADASNELNIGGSRSTVAVFPPPSVATVPIAHNCIVTKATAGGIGWNLIQGASSEQYSDQVCVLQWLSSTATDPSEREALRAELAKRLGVRR